MTRRTTSSASKNQVSELLAVRVTADLLRRIDHIANRRSTMWHPVTRSAVARIVLEAGMAALENDPANAIAPRKRRASRRREAA